MWRTLAIAAFLLWPIIPITWLQVHGNPKFWRRLGGKTYVVIISEWVIAAAFSYSFRDLLLGEQLKLGAFSWLGLLPLGVGVAIQVWATRVLHLRSLVGYPELKPSEAGQKLVTDRPFSVVRNPTYLAHTLILVGVFLVTGYSGTAFLAVADLLIVYFVVIPLEEKELEERFGAKYRDYKSRVPRFLPKIL